MISQGVEKILIQQEVNGTYETITYEGADQKIEVATNRCLVRGPGDFKLAKGVTTVAVAVALDGAPLA